MAETPKPLPLSYPFERYTQKVVLHFSNAEAAQKADVRLAPLYDDYTRAVSCRYDDNQFNDLKVKELLDRYGVKANWYFNSNNIFYLWGKDFRPTALKLLENGHAIGGHGITHPYITYMNRNRFLKETLGVRVEWESNLDTLLHSYAFSFVNYRDAFEGDIMQADVLRSLERAGYYHLSVYKTFDDQLPSDFVISVIMPPENQTLEQFKQAVDWAMTSDDLLERFRCFSHSMHGWYGTEAVEYGFDELEKRVAYMNSFPDLWHCNQNQYAAYTYQFRHTDLQVEKREGRKVFCRLERPVLRYLNDPVPLTLTVEGATTESLLWARADAGLVERSERNVSGKALLHVHHGRDQGLPVSIGALENPENGKDLVAPDEPMAGLSGRLHFDGKKLELKLKNESDGDLRNLVATYRLPLAWKEGVRLHREERLQKGDTLSHEWAPTPSTDDPKYLCGTHYFYVQLDYLRGDLPERLYLSCEKSFPIPDVFPHGRFAILGGVAPQAFTPESFAATLDKKGAPALIWESPDGQTLYWRKNDEDRRIKNDHLGPEVLRVHGDWHDTAPPVYLLWSVVESEEGQPFSVMTDPEAMTSLWVNGEAVESLSGQLQKGKNHLVFAYREKMFRGQGSHAVCFFRLTRPGMTDRLENVRFHLPEVPSSAEVGASSAPGRAWYGPGLEKDDK